MTYKSLLGYFSSESTMFTSLPPRRLRWSAWAAGRSSPNCVPAPYSGNVTSCTRQNRSQSDQSANPASVPGRSGLQRAFLSVSSAQKCSGAGRLATPSGVSRAARSAVPCRPPFQGTELAALSTPEASLERLVPLVGHPAAWEPLPSVSHWDLPEQTLVPSLP